MTLGLRVLRTGSTRVTPRVTDEKLKKEAKGR